MLPVYEEASSRPLTAVAQDVLHCRDKLADLDIVAQKEASLKEELKVVIDLPVDLNLSIEHRQPVPAATFLARRPCASQATDITEPIQKATAELKDTTQTVGRDRHQLLVH